MQIEIAVIRRHFHDLFALDQFFADPTMRDQTLNGADAEAVFFAEPHQLRQTRHRAVVMQNFAEHPGRLQSGHGAPDQLPLRCDQRGARRRRLLLAKERHGRVARDHSARRWDWR